jgi:hypothetical protein
MRPLSLAAVARPPLPVYPPTVPVPATVVIIPVLAVTLRTTELPLSAIYMLFNPSIYTPHGALSLADVARPPSPEKPAELGVPTTVVIIPVDLVILRIV